MSNYIQRKIEQLGLPRPRKEASIPRRLANSAVGAGVFGGTAAAGCALYGSTLGPQGSVVGAAVCGAGGAIYGAIKGWNNPL